MASRSYYFVVCYCLFFCISETKSYHQIQRIDEATEGINFRDEKGNIHYIDLTTPLDSIFPIFLTRRYFAGSTRFWLYTRDNVNRQEELYPRFRKISLSNSKLRSLYRPDRPLVVVTHGWMSSGYSNATQLIKNAYLKILDVNVIVADWEGDASYENYVSSASLTMEVAEKVKDMVLSLAFQYQLDGKYVHLIGHSLGAHVMGLAGMKLKDNHFIVARVTGLDPARPFFELPNYLPGITNESASFVDIIHTDSGVLGYIANIGHVDFYPNGGNWQPHCCDTQDTLSCEHTCSYVYFAETVKGRKYVSEKCDSYFSFMIGSCGDNEKQFMGFPSSSAARGSFYLDIDRQFQNSEDPNKIEFIDEKGIVHYIDLSAPLDIEILTSRRNAADVQFWLYSRDNMNNYEELFLHKDDAVFMEKSASVYKSKKPLVMVTHGWLTSGAGNASQSIKNAFLKQHDVNLIVVNWEKEAGRFNYVLSAALTAIVAERAAVCTLNLIVYGYDNYPYIVYQYMTSHAQMTRVDVRMIGKQLFVVLTTEVKNMILLLANRYQIEGQDVHLIGHSLGAHVMGLAGKILKQWNNFTVGRITGLDPARPFFELPNNLAGITSDAAAFVDIIHTNSGFLGYIDSIGHVDFYPNGGIWQPHCCKEQKACKDIQ